jgi:hypothetical protein
MRRPSACKLLTWRARASAFPTGGAFGAYYMHGGDWYHGAGELHSCVMAFPITVEASLVINSARGAIPYQCSLLQSAFDNACVAH